MSGLKQKVNPMHDSIVIFKLFFNFLFQFSPEGLFFLRFSSFQLLLFLSKFNIEDYVASIKHFQLIKTQSIFFYLRPSVPKPRSSSLGRAKISTKTNFPFYIVFWANIHAKLFSCLIFFSSESFVSIIYRNKSLCKINED